MQTTRLKKYLYAFSFFNSGVQTVMLLATIFASKAIKWPEDEGTTGLIIAILLIQILAAIGAKLMSNISIKIGNISTLKISVFIWIFLCFGAYFITSPTEFYILASCRACHGRNSIYRSFHLFKNTYLKLQIMPAIFHSTTFLKKWESCWNRIFCIYRMEI